MQPIEHVPAVRGSTIAHLLLKLIMLLPMVCIHRANGSNHPVLRACIVQGKGVRRQHASFFNGPEINRASECFSFESITADRCDSVIHLTTNQKGEETNAVSADLTALVGDELCQLRTKEDLSLVGAVQMYSALQASDAARIYIPLGPHRLFSTAMEARTDAGMIRNPASSRRLLFSVAAAMTAGRSKHLKRAVESSGLNAVLPGKSWFVHLIKRQIDPSSPEATRKDRKGAQILLDSAFTLCPGGVNPESFRIWEAIIAGSIPIVARDIGYQKGPCREALSPLIESGAPFVVLDDWQQLPAKLVELAADPAAMNERQSRLMVWYKSFIRYTTTQIEAALLKSMRRRAPHGSNVSLTCSHHLV